MSLRSRIAKIEARCPARLTAEEFFEMRASGIIAEYEIAQYAERMSEAELERAIAMITARLEGTACAGWANG